MRLLGNSVGSMFGFDEPCSHPPGEARNLCCSLSSKPAEEPRSVEVCLITLGLTAADGGVELRSVEVCLITLGLAASDGVEEERSVEVCLIILGLPRVSSFESSCASPPFILDLESGLNFAQRDMFRRPQVQFRR